VKDTIARASLLSTNVTMKFSPYWQPHHHPYQSVKGQVFKVTVSIAYADMNSINFNMFSPSLMSLPIIMVSQERNGCLRCFLNDFY
jgi:hypothetical protein